RAVYYDDPADSRCIILDVDPARVEALAEGRIRPSAEQVACGVTHATWRAALEAAHARFTDAEMAYMNIATTIDLVDACTDIVDWDAVCAVLFDPDRTVLPSKTASAALAEDWDEICADMEDLVDDMEARPEIAPALWAELMCRGWWGMP